MIVRRPSVQRARLAGRPWLSIAIAPILLLAMLGLAGCSTPSWLCYLPPGPHDVTLIATPDANQGAAVAVDVVLISDQVAAKQIGALSASDYFTQRTQLEHDFPTGFVVRSWGLAPGQVASDMPVNPTCNRVSTLLFARYATPGDHRQVLGTSNIVVTLGDSDFSVAP
jgi:type VI secretion system protein